jgi:hypothetical protein
LARLANAEDDCTGRFWEGRFKSQALLDEAGLLTAMAYVDLNPIRAGVANKPEDSEFTSIEQRIRQLKLNVRPSAPTGTSIPLRRFTDPEDQKRTGIPYTFVDYLQLVDWTGRCIRADKRGSIALSHPPILKRLGIEAEGWTELLARRGSILGRAMGRLDSLRLHAATLGQTWLRGMGRSQHLYG